MVSWLLTNVPEQSNGEKIALTTNGGQTTGYTNAKDVVNFLLHNILRNLLKLDHRPNYKS